MPQYLCSFDGKETFDFGNLGKSDLKKITLDMPLSLIKHLMSF
jgi:hypothetical protein